MQRFVTSRKRRYIKYLLDWIGLEIEEEIFWKNSHIRFKNSILLFSKWYVAGICKVKHVITNGSWKYSILLNSNVGIHQLLFEFEYAKLKK